MDVQERYQAASIKTAANLKTIATRSDLLATSRLSLPEIEAVSDLVSQIIPAGNVPGIILSGMARLSGRKVPRKVLKRDVDLIFQGVEKTLDKAVYSAVFAGPAAVIWGYQNLLKLAGRQPEDAFPEGAWQFYIEYALRDDTARHTNETHGFDTVLNKHGIHLAPADRLTAWVMAVIHLLRQYDALIENEWRERVYTRLLREVTAECPEARRYQSVYRAWQQFIPYRRGKDAAPDEPYPAYRRRRFDQFIKSITADLSPDLRRKWQRQIRQEERDTLPAYQRQMSILATLEAGEYGETRVPIALADAQIVLIVGGNYYLLPVCSDSDGSPPSVQEVRTRVAALFRTPAKDPQKHQGLTELACIPRAELARLTPRLNPELRASLNTLRLAPIIINADQRPRSLPLAELRQTERGIGAHPLTIFDTGETFVFDQSHIFFDGTWGAALAEILTNEALSWAVYLDQLPPLSTIGSRPSILHFDFQPDEVEQIRKLPRVPVEASAETEDANLSAIVGLRKLFKRRNDLLGLTVNDLLVLYRAIHALTYQPDPTLLAELKMLRNEASTRKAALAALDAVENDRSNPAILIPVDAGQIDPKDRLFPLVFEPPIEELDLMELHRKTVAAHIIYKTAPSNERGRRYAEFDRFQRTYLAALAGFGEILSRYIDLALQGESTSVGAIRMIAHMPVPVQRMLDKVPHRLDMLNDLIKGREVLSNVGAVAPSSTLLRFITAKDDNEKKTLVWGVITDARGQMRISLRDFRPHVGLLSVAGHHDLAVRITRDYLQSYATGLNRYIAELHSITLSSRETTMSGGLRHAE